MQVSAAIVHPQGHAARFRELDRVGKQVVTHLHNPFLIPEQHFVPFKLHNQFQAFVCCKRSELGLQRIGYVPQGKRHRVRLFLATIEAEVAKHRVQHGNHTAGSEEGFPGIVLCDGGIRFLRCHFRVTDNGGQRCAQFVRDGLHDSVAVGNELLVLLDRLLQLFHVLFQLFPAGCLHLDVPMDFQVGKGKEKDG